MAAEPVAEVAHDERPDRPGDVADTEGRQRRDGGGGGVARGEEDLREHQRGGGPVDDEVVVLQRAADPRGDRGLLRRPGREPVGGDRSGGRVRVWHRCQPFARIAGTRCPAMDVGQTVEPAARRWQTFAIICHMPPQRRPRAVTITDVARAAGVAPSTVSRAVTRPDRVNAVTREHVLEVANRLGYRPSPVARALGSGRTRTLALILPDITNPYFAGVIRGAERQAAATGHVLVIGQLRGVRARRVADRREAGRLGRRLPHRVEPDERPAHRPDRRACARWSSSTARRPASPA